MIDSQSDALVFYGVTGDLAFQENLSCASGDGQNAVNSTYLSWVWPDPLDSRSVTTAGGARALKSMGGVDPAAPRGKSRTFCVFELTVNRSAGTGVGVIRPTRAQLIREFVECAGSTPPCFSRLSRTPLS